MGNTPPSASPLPENPVLSGLIILSSKFFISIIIFYPVLERTLELGRFSASSNLTLELGPDF